MSEFRIALSVYSVFVSLIGICAYLLVQCLVSGIVEPVGMCYGNWLLLGMFVASFMGLFASMQLLLGLVDS